jgi:hypothetical protein
VSSRFFFFLSAVFAFEPSRLSPSFHPHFFAERFSLGASWASSFQRCCYLIIDLGSYLFDGSWARTWAQSPELGGRDRLFGSNARPRRSPLCGCSAPVHRLPRSPTTCVAVRPTSVPRQRRLVSWHSFLPARLASAPSAGEHCPVQRVQECSAHLALSVSLDNGLLPC